ncbi:Rcs stress response system protein RcsF [Thalassotalea sediminis]|uniref:Rcs stress response system protein RcsF n=1 Tax=Thalassotalea sediminis TaxID=1759089 RepID=UPI0025737DFB|nr:Rcs stress response system protein RcsF [Thalassotalea sediminis]
MTHYLSSVFVIVCTVLLGACSSQYAVKTNVDKTNFSRYFSPTKVKIYQNEQELPSTYQSLGGVEGESCQSKSHHEMPNIIDARTDARRTAFQQGANAIIFTNCALIENNQADKKCIRTRVCYGRIFFINDKSN